MAGVCAGVAAHLGLSVTLVRFLAVAAAFCGGAGVMLYVLLWIAVPAGDPWAEAAGAAPPSRARLAGRPTELISVSGRLRSILGGGALLLAAVLLELWREGLLSSVSWGGPLIVTGCGTALVWSQVDAVTKPGHGIGARVRMTGGVALAAVGILMWMSRDTAPGALLAGSLTSIALIVGIGLILTPLWLRTNRALTETRAAEVREAERADIAAHLHDSVLQALTLIRASAEDPARVRAIALTEERELRAWLYTGHAQAADSLEAAVTEAVVGVESRYGVPISVVVVGDMCPGPGELALVAALAEACQNAVRHGAPPVSVYVEVRPRAIEAFIKDNGEGFDPATIAADRHGVRDSIVGRMRRAGGSATVRRLARGTEIALSVPRSDILEQTAPTGRTQ